jgi:hypothetical protein
VTDLSRYYDESYPPSLWAGPPPPPPPPPPPVPAESWTKAQIVAWLLDHGVTLDETALMALTKAELLALAADLSDDETEP